MENEKTGCGASKLTSSHKTQLASNERRKLMPVLWGCTVDIDSEAVRVINHDYMNLAARLPGGRQEFFFVAATSCSVSYGCNDRPAWSTYEQSFAHRPMDQINIIDCSLHQLPTLTCSIQLPSYES